MRTIVVKQDGESAITAELDYDHQVGKLVFVDDDLMMEYDFEMKDVMCRMPGEDLRQTLEMIAHGFLSGGMRFTDDPTNGLQPHPVDG